jgi:hypothetical protein
MRNTIFACFLLVANTLLGQNQVPIISGLTASVDWPSNSLTLTFEVADAENDALEINVEFSDDGGKTYALTPQIPVAGDVGFPIEPGGRSITCDISSIANVAAAFTVRVVADDKQVFDVQQLVNEVDSNRLRADLEFVEGIRHRTTGLSHLNAVRDSLKNCFQNAGLHYEEQTFTFANFTGRNLIGSASGTAEAQKVIIVDAHYDTVSNAPGADDNGSGTVGVLEIARLLSRYPTKKTIRFIGFDLEEAGLQGSTRYAASGIPASEQIEGVFNFEMIGYWSDEPNTQVMPTGFNVLFPAAYDSVEAHQFRGDFITNVGNTASQSLALLFNNSAQQYVPGLRVIPVIVPGNGFMVPDLRRSDHAPFWDSNRKALMLTDGAEFRNECYHTPGDTLDEKLNFTFMSNVVKATLASIAQLAEIQHADWEITSFQGSVATHAPTPCETIEVQQIPDQHAGMVLRVSGCSPAAATFELFDAKGTRVFQQLLQLPTQGQMKINTPHLPTGIYILKINRDNHLWAGKIILP